MLERSADSQTDGSTPGAAVSFGLFVFWLLALPMEGPLLAHTPDDGHLLFFLFPHVVALFLVGRFWPSSSFPRASLLATLATGALTLALLLFPAWQGPLLAACGVSAAFVSIRAGLLLRQSRNSLLAAAGGLVLGNLLLLLLLRLPLPSPAGHLLAAAALAALLKGIRPEEPGNLVALYRVLPAIFVFQLASGLMYGFLMPAYGAVALWNGAELPFYLASVLLAVPLLRRDRELLLVVGVVLGLAAFLCLRAESPAAIHLAMFGMQGAAGCVDMFLLACMLGGGNAQRAFGTGNAVLCGGILLGALFTRLFENLVGPAIAVSQVALNGAVLILYLQNRRRLPEVPPTAESGAVSPVPMLPATVAVLLSVQELQVLGLVQQGKTYREVGRSLEISESSVKTYMNRICGKLGVTNKKALLRALAERNASQFPGSA